MNVGEAQHEMLKLVVQRSYLALGHGGEHGVQGGGVVGDEADLGHPPVRLHLSS